MRSLNPKLDDDDVLRSVRLFRNSRWTSGNAFAGKRAILEFANGLPAKFCVSRNVVHVSFFREKGDKLLRIQFWPLSSSIEFSDDFFIATTRLGRPRQCLRVDILPDVRQFAVLNGNGEDPIVLERFIRG